MFVVSEFMENLRPKVWLACWVRLSGLAELPELLGLTGLAGLASVAGLHWPGLLAAFAATAIATATAIAMAMAMATAMAVVRPEHAGRGRPPRKLTFFTENLYWTYFGPWSPIHSHDLS